MHVCILIILQPFPTIESTHSAEVRSKMGSTGSPEVEKKAKAYERNMRFLPSVLQPMVWIYPGLNIISIQNQDYTLQGLRSAPQKFRILSCLFNTLQSAWRSEVVASSELLPDFGILVSPPKSSAWQLRGPHNSSMPFGCHGKRWGWKVKENNMMYDLNEKVAVFSSSKMHLCIWIRFRLLQGGPCPIYGFGRAITTAAPSRRCISKC